VTCRRGKGKPTDDPFMTPTDRKGKAKGKVVDTTNKEVAIANPAYDELEDEDEIVEDEIPVSDWQASGLEDDEKPFAYHEDLHKRR